ncbi:hypothetical protein [Yersinia ruckeri]|uniref:hypothetical protein n=1 Tax=Yersinia ruckeri TaxID=29486 RepID=UPI0020BFAC9C|nr:hypothetical protein [Yersinia ruckeri]EKN4689547.1 hypothetical protein [Yersinia ruckeri]MCK8586572.1 hypothetical protein [Yersinia ruckeri]MCW6615835.1 hypothetical protein [Yersinia ruckeri]
MVLSPLEVLDLQDQLSELIGKLAAADPLSQLDLQDDITSILEKLGYAATQSVQPLVDTNTGTDPAPVDQPPQIVIDYLAGTFSTQTTDDFIATLENIEPYVTTFITMPQVCDGANSWWETTGKQLAA